MVGTKSLLHLLSLVECVRLYAYGVSHQQVGVGNCDGKNCPRNSPHCMIRQHPHLHGYCVADWECHQQCRVNHQLHGHSHSEHCCCYFDVCTNNYFHSSLATTTHAHIGHHHTATLLHPVTHTTTTNTLMTSLSTTAVPGLLCYTCADVTKNGCLNSPINCGIDEICKITNDLNSVVSAQCEAQHVCLSDSVMANLDQSPHVQVKCCGDNTCTNHTIETLITGTSTSVQCSECQDGFRGLCRPHSVCKSNQDCMLQVVSGKFVSGCIETTNCTNEKKLNPDTFCCQDNKCVTEKTKYINQQSFICPACTSEKNGSECSLYPQKCSPQSQGCSIIRDINGFNATCESNIIACLQAQLMNDPVCFNDSIPFNVKVNLQCTYCCGANQTTCISSALQHSADILTMPTAPAYSIAQQTTFTPASLTTAGTSESTTTAASCEDQVELNFDCSAYNTNFSICSFTSGFGAHIAYDRCKKTCNHCNDTLSSQPMEKNTPTAPSIQPMTFITTPTGLPPCMDVNTATCLHLKDAVCSAVDLNTREYAIMNCTKTCNLCDVYYQRLLMDMTTISAQTTATSMMCHQCGDYTNSRPCALPEVFGGSPSLCPPNTKYCQTDVYHDQYGNKEVYKRCVNTDTCRREWLDHSSDHDYCVQYGQSPPSGEYTCHFCCTTPGCNQNIEPDITTLFLKEN